MKREWEPEELVEGWTLFDADWRLIGNKTGATRLGFALMLRFFELEARFPGYPAEIPAAAVGYIAVQVGVEPGLFAKYGFTGRTAEAAVEHPDERVRDVMFPVVGEQTLRDLVCEARASEEGISGAGAHDAAQFLHRPLPADAACDVHGAGVPL